LNNKSGQAYHEKLNVEFILQPQALLTFFVKLPCGKLRCRQENSGVQSLNRRRNFPVIPISLPSSWKPSLEITAKQ